MNLLALCQEFAKRTGLPVPTFVASNSDAGVAQMMGLLNEFCDDLYTRKTFQAANFEATFVSTASDDQGSISTIAPYGYVSLIPDTFFDRTDRRAMLGGLSPAEWQMRKATQIAGPFYQFRVWQDRLRVSPTMPAGHTVAFEYRSSWFVQNNSVTVPDPALYRQYWFKDTDSCRVGDALPLAWLRWAWKKEKGLDYAEDFTKYERMVNTYVSADAAPRTLNMGDAVERLTPGIWVPEGSWPV